MEKKKRIFEQSIGFRTENMGFNFCGTSKDFLRTVVEALFIVHASGCSGCKSFYLFIALKMNVFILMPTCR